MSKLIEKKDFPKVIAELYADNADVMCGHFTAQVYDNCASGKCFQFRGPGVAWGADNSGVWSINGDEAEDIAQILEYIARKLRE